MVAIHVGVGRSDRVSIAIGRGIVARQPRLRENLMGETRKGLMLAVAGAPIEYVRLGWRICPNRDAILRSRCEWTAVHGCPSFLPGRCRSPPNLSVATLLSL